MRTTNRIQLLLIGAVSLSLVACGSERHYRVQPVIITEHDRKDIPPPEEKNLNLYENAFENIFVEEIDQFSNLSWHWRKLSNQHKQAKNTNVFDEVPNSTWFTNRNAKTEMSVEAIRRGPNRGSGPDTSGVLTVINAKTEGATPGLQVRDSRGEVYFIKFDIKGYPDLNTAAEIITTKLVYAAGYNTPENYLSRIDPKKLRIADGVTVRNRWGRDVSMTRAWLDKLLQQAEVDSDGSYRVVASKRLEGKPIGPFVFDGVREDDPNDHIPHHHRRELRGYKVLSAWLNNYDAKANNTLDVYVTENGRSFVKHYMIDFGSTLGSSGRGPASSSRGKRGAFDLGNMLLRIFTLGLYVEPWERAPEIISPSIGYFDSEYFDPGEYAFIIPNPAFQRATELDNFWGAKLVMSFTDEQIRAVVETAEYHDKADEEHVSRTLIERRDKTGRYWFAKVNPLDNFTLSRNNEGGVPVIAFDDLAVNAGFEAASETRYRYRLRYRGKDLSGYFYSDGKPELPFTDEAVARIEDKLRDLKTPFEPDRIFAFQVETKRTNGPWSKGVRVFFYYPDDNRKSLQIVALEREN